MLYDQFFKRLKAVEVFPYREVRRKPHFKFKKYIVIIKHKTIYIFLILYYFLKVQKHTKKLRTKREKISIVRLC